MKDKEVQGVGNLLSGILLSVKLFKHLIMLFKWTKMFVRKFKIGGNMADQIWLIIWAVAEAEVQVGKILEAAAC